MTDASNHAGGGQTRPLIVRVVCAEQLPGSGDVLATLAYGTQVAQTARHPGGGEITFDEEFLFEVEPDGTLEVAVEAAGEVVGRADVPIEALLQVAETGRHLEVEIGDEVPNVKGLLVLAAAHPGQSTPAHSLTPDVSTFPATLAATPVTAPAPAYASPATPNIPSIPHFTVAPAVTTTRTSAGAPASGSINTLSVEVVSLAPSPAPTARELAVQIVVNGVERTSQGHAVGEGAWQETLAVPNVGETDVLEGLVLADWQYAGDFAVPIGKLLEVAGSGQCLEVELTKGGLPSGSIVLATGFEGTLLQGSAQPAAPQAPVHRILPTTPLPAPTAAPTAGPRTVVEVRPIAAATANTTTTMAANGIVTQATSAGNAYSESGQWLAPRIVRRRLDGQVVTTEGTRTIPARPQPSRRVVPLGTSPFPAIAPLAPLAVPTNAPRQLVTSRGGVAFAQQQQQQRALSPTWREGSVLRPPMDTPLAFQSASGGVRTVTQAAATATSAGGATGAQWVGVRDRVGSNDDQFRVNARYLGSHGTGLQSRAVAVADPLMAAAPVRFTSSDASYLTQPPFVNGGRGYPVERVAGGYVGPATPQTVYEPAYVTQLPVVLPSGATRARGFANTSAFRTSQIAMEGETALDASYVSQQPGVYVDGVPQGRGYPVRGAPAGWAGAGGRVQVTAPVVAPHSYTAGYGRPAVFSTCCNGAGGGAATPYAAAPFLGHYGDWRDEYVAQMVNDLEHPIDAGPTTRVFDRLVSTSVPHPPPNPLPRPPISVRSPLTASPSTGPWPPQAFPPPPTFVPPPPTGPYGGRVLNTALVEYFENAPGRKIR